MSAYLAAWEKHKFPPLLIVGREKWVDEHSEFGATGGKAIRDSVLTTPFGHGCCELSVNSDVTFYALDPAPPHGDSRIANLNRRERVVRVKSARKNMAE